jgi:outer membrane biosynthesis protein TonB
MTGRAGRAAMRNKIRRKVQPNVPDRFRAIRGTVLLEIAIDGDGKVIGAVAKSGPLELFACSVKAVEQWLYKPTTVGGNPVIVITSVEIKYE